MLTRKTQYAWMALGGLICLFGLVLACILHDGNKAIAQAGKRELPPLLRKKLASPPPPMISKPASKPSSPSSFGTTEPKKATSEKSEKTKKPVQKDKSSEPKATLDMPFPAAASSPKPSPAKTPSMPAYLSPTSFAPNSPTPPKPEPLPPPSKVPDVKSKPVSPAAMTVPSPTPPPSHAKTPLPEKTKEKKPRPAWNDPALERSVTPAGNITIHDINEVQPGEPPLAPAPGPVQIYHVHGRETLRDIARRTLGTSERWSDLHKLNPKLNPQELLRAGTTVRLPADACVQTDDVNPVKPLPALRRKPAAPKAKVLPLTGTYQCSLDANGRLTLPRAIRDQLNGNDTVLLSPGPDTCLWLTNQPHLERLGERLDQSQANEADVRVFKRLYFAQTEKLSVNGDGRVVIPERLSAFAGLQQEVVLVGIDDHFEVWDAARWRAYTRQKSAARSTAMAEQE